MLMLGNGLKAYWLLGVLIFFFSQWEVSQANPVFESIQEVAVLSYFLRYSMAASGTTVQQIVLFFRLHGSIRSLGLFQVNQFPCDSPKTWHR